MGLHRTNEDTLNTKNKIKTNILHLPNLTVHQPSLVQLIGMEQKRLCVGAGGHLWVSQQGGQRSAIHDEV